MPGTLDANRMETELHECRTRRLLCVMECPAEAMKFELYHRVEESEKG